ncbi:hypothetical protein EDC01DRAFT_745033 [Geopyxis carbonaria]|nr:hypothetical protein EDC01DRAFT_745033 [Geopyxis carbonaria]
MAVLIAVFVTLVVAAIIIGVGCWLGIDLVGLDIHHGSSLLAIDPQANGKLREILFFYQDSDSSIRFLQHQNNTGTWITNGVPEALVYPKALLGTSITALAYMLKEELNVCGFDSAHEHGMKVLTMLQIRVFFTGADGYLVERISNNKKLGLWYDGSLRSEGYKASKQPGAALAACYNRYYGDPNDPDSPGVHVWFGDPEGSLQEINWTPKDMNNRWNYFHKFSGLNGHSSVDCTARNQSTTYIYTSDRSGKLQILFYDFEESHDHSTKTWTPVLEWEDVQNNTAISAITYNKTERYIHFVNKAGQTVQKRLEGRAENLTWSEETFIVGENTGMKIEPRSGLASVILNSTLGGPELHVFSIVKGGKIVDFIRSFLSTYWATVTLPLENKNRGRTKLQLK